MNPHGSRSPLNPYADDDTTLVALAVDGDRDALARLVTGHQPDIFNIAMRM